LVCSLLYSLDVPNYIPASCICTCTYGLPHLMKISGKLLTCCSPLKKHKCHKVFFSIREILLNSRFLHRADTNSLNYFPGFYITRMHTAKR
jgi:hypothetical protein